MISINLKQLLLILCILNENAIIFHTFVSVIVCSSCLTMYMNIYVCANSNSNAYIHVHVYLHVRISI